MSNIVITPSNGKQYKRRDRSVSPETAQKISSSLKNNYWTQIPPKHTNEKDVPPQNGF